MRRIRIDRLDVHLRSVSPATARAAARHLRTALQAELGESGAAMPTASRSAAGRRGIADAVARQVAGRIGRRS